MNDNEKEIVEMYDENEIEMLKAQMDSDGHKPRKGCREYQQDHTGTWKGVDERMWYSKKTKMPLLVLLPRLYIHV